MRATDRKVPAREKASKMIIDLATMINPQTRFKKKKQWNNLERKKNKTKRNPQIAKAKVITFQKVLISTPEMYPFCLVHLVL